MNSNADSEDVLRVGGFYMLLDLALTFVLRQWIEFYPLHFFDMPVVERCIK